MTDTENVFDGFALLGDDEEFDVDKIFGSGSDEPAPPPPAPTLAEEVKPQFDPEQAQTETAESQPEPEQTLPAKTQEVPAEEKQPLELFSAFTGVESAPIPEAAPVKSIAPRPQTQLSLFDKPPVFQYGGAREQITDSDMTFGPCVSRKRMISLNWRMRLLSLGRYGTEILRRPSPRPRRTPSRP